MEWSTMASWCPKGSTGGEAMGAQVKKRSFTKIREREESSSVWNPLQCFSGIRRGNLASSTFPPTSPGKGVQKSWPPTSTTGEVSHLSGVRMSLMKGVSLYRLR